jgi:hypothetical protein
MVLGRPEEMNCSMAICAVASCMATRSAKHNSGCKSAPVCMQWHLDAAHVPGLQLVVQALPGLPAQATWLQCVGRGLTRAQPQVAGATLDVLALGVIQVTVHHLRGRQAAASSAMRSKLPEDNCASHET